MLPPRIVRELDWVEKFWPNTKKGRGHNYPKVQLYCLMGVGGAWTVSRYHQALCRKTDIFESGLAYRLRRIIGILPHSKRRQGMARSKLYAPVSKATNICTRQVFYFIRPTPANLAAYERWSGTEVQNHSWLGDMCDEVFKVELKAGNTMIIPTGWIHAVVSSSLLVWSRPSMTIATVHACRYVGLWW